MSTSNTYHTRSKVREEEEHVRQEIEQAMAELMDQLNQSEQKGLEVERHVGQSQ